MKPGAAQSHTLELSRFAEKQMGWRDLQMDKLVVKQLDSLVDTLQRERERERQADR